MTAALRALFDTIVTELRIDRAVTWLANRIG